MMLRIHFGNPAEQVTRTVIVSEAGTGADNAPDADVNIALLPDAVLTGTVTDGRGTPDAILYDPVADDYVIRTNYQRIRGGLFRVNLGRPGAEDGFEWRVNWDTPKKRELHPPSGVPIPTSPSPIRYGVSATYATEFGRSSRKAKAVG